MVRVTCRSAITDPVAAAPRGNFHSSSDCPHMPAEFMSAFTTYQQTAKWVLAGESAAADRCDFFIFASLHLHAHHLEHFLIDDRWVHTFCVVHGRLAVFENIAASRSDHHLDGVAVIDEGGNIGKGAVVGAGCAVGVGGHAFEHCVAVHRCGKYSDRRGSCASVHAGGVGELAPASAECGIVARGCGAGDAAVHDRPLIRDIGGVCCATAPHLPWQSDWRPLCFCPDRERFLCCCGMSNRTGIRRQR